MPVARPESGAMLFASRNITVRCDHGVAELALGFPGVPANALDVARLRELEAALQSVAASDHVQILVVQSALPAGFCSGIRPPALASLTRPADRSAFAWYGQQVFDRLARLEAVTVAYVDGPCLGAGLELALACDYRICVARPTTLLGFPDRRACFGGTERLHDRAGRRGDELLATGRTISAREAVQLGIVDLACCERRATIELRTFLDRLELRAVKPRTPVDPVGWAAERRRFAALEPPAPGPNPAAQLVLRNPIPSFPGLLGLLGNDPNADRLAAEIVLRGGSVAICGNRSGVFAGISAALRRGFITPLEAEQSWRRVRASDSLDGFDQAGLILVADGQNPFRLAAAVRPRAIICVLRPTGSDLSDAAPVPAVPFPFPGRVVRMSFCEGQRIALLPGTATSPDTLATLSDWLSPFGFTTTVFPVAARLLPRAA